MARSSPAAPVSLPDDDDLLREILLRLAPLPSSLPRASAVCKRWRRLVTDRKFLECFRASHREPPLLGYFEWTDNGIVFSSVLDPPDRIPPQRFGLGDNSRNGMLGCRHGRVLVRDFPRSKIWVLDPVTGELCGLDAPRKFNPVAFFVKGAVLCAAADRSHVHGSCHSSPFKVVLVCIHGYWDPRKPIAFVYSWETGIWRNLPLAKAPSEQYHFANSGVVVGNVLYWSSMSTTGHMLSCSTPPAVPRLRERGHLRKYWIMMRIMVYFFYLWTHMSTWFSLKQCNPGNFLKNSPMSRCFILSKVSIHQAGQGANQGQRRRQNPYQYIRPQQQQLPAQRRHQQLQQQIPADPQQQQQQQQQRQTQQGQQIQAPRGGGGEGGPAGGCRPQRPPQQTTEEVTQPVDPKYRDIVCFNCRLPGHFVGICIKP